MKNTIYIVIGVIAALVVGLLIGYFLGDKNHTYSVNDGVNGVIVLENSSGDFGYGIEFQEGQVPINVAVYSGTAKISILKGEDVLFEEEFDKSKDIKVDIPKVDYYKVMISGKNITGIIKYPVSDSTNSNVDKIPEL